MNTYIDHLKESKILVRDAKTVEQVGSKNMALVYLHDGDVLLYSYTTLAGVRKKDKWYLTTQKHSPTTSRQLNAFSKGKEVTWVSKDDRVGEYYI